MTVPHPTRSTAARASCALILASLSLVGCSSVENLVSGDKVDYKTTGQQTKGLDVPPDLTQLARDSRYQQPVGGTVSAAEFQAGAAAGQPAATNVVAPAALGDAHLERNGSERWVATSQTPEQLWPQLQSFWAERGFTLVTDDATVGVMETEWAENRAKLPNDILRNTIGKVFDGLWSTGERDKFRTRVERGRNGSEIYISHRGMVEVYSSREKDQTVWQPRPADPQIEAEMLQRVLIKLGAKVEAAKAQAATVAAAGGTGAAAVPGVPRARLLEGADGVTVQVDDGFDRAWRRVGIALDRSGFTVEDRDRGQGLYFVRYVDPAYAGREEPGFFSKLFSFGKKDDAIGVARYRVSVKSDGDRSTVAVLNSQGTPETGPAGRRIASLLVDDLK